MKKMMLGMLVAALLVSAGAPLKAQSAAETVTFSGLVRYNGVPQAGMKVLLECWGTGDNWYLTTDSNGAYYLVTTTERCPLGTELKVRAESADYVAYKYSTVQRLTVTHLDLVAKIPIPEYDWVGGVLAGGAGIGALVIARRHFVARGMSA